MSKYRPLMNKYNVLPLFFIINIQLSLGCATPNRTIVVGMVAGGLIGAGIGQQFRHDGDKDRQLQNMAISAGVFSLLTGGLLAWHYQEVEAEVEKVSGRFSRYRLCDPSDGNSVSADFLPVEGGRECENHAISGLQIENSAISLDDDTKWVYPQFRKRYLLPDRGENQVISKRYLWEIIKPGIFVTRSQNPLFFSQESKVVPENNSSPAPDHKSKEGL